MGRIWIEVMIRFGILICSDRSARNERPDRTGPLLGDFIKTKKWEVVRSEIVPDILDTIGETLTRWVDQDDLDVILTSGGTGFSPRDVTPEATISVVDRLVPGMAEAMRNKSLQKTPHAMLSRGVAGIRGKVLIVNLPGNPGAALENLEVIIPVLEHAIELLNDDALSESHHLIHKKHNQEKEV